MSQFDDLEAAIADLSARVDAVEAADSGLAARMDAAEADVAALFARPVPVGYSADEVSTGLMWLDGKTIYRKVVDLGALPNAATKTVPHDIVGLETVVSCTGRTSNGTVSVSLPFAAPASASSIAISADVTNVYAQTGSNRTGFTSTHAFIEYTKA